MTDEFLDWGQKLEKNIFRVNPPWKFCTFVGKQKAMAALVFCIINYNSRCQKIYYLG